MTDKNRTDRYKRSTALLRRSCSVIPGGAQTLSKGPAKFTAGQTPFFIQRGRGARLIDVDGNYYIDFNNALCAILLGHSDAEVDEAVAAQLGCGNVFPFSHALEIEVAELIVDLVPCADMVRFGKNGSDATSAAIRLARVHTGRERIARCGYHGWPDWWADSGQMWRGVPGAVSKLTDAFAYNDLASLQRLLVARPGEYAAVIMEPMNRDWPAEGFLEGVAEMTRRHGALLVFDEMITGFRLARGGAQEYFGVIPDLACFGKGLANGFPLSALAGRGDVMQGLQDTFFSLTMAGETMSLAAARATLQKLRYEDVPERLTLTGTRLMQGLDKLVKKAGCKDFFAVSGHPSWSFLILLRTGTCEEYRVRALIDQELFARGFIATGTHNMSYAHTNSDVDDLLNAYEDILPMVASAIADDAVSDALHAEPPRPRFRVR